MSKKLTRWFPASAKPARVGVYEKDFGIGDRQYQYWDGRRWYYGDDDPETTARRGISATYGIAPNSRRWRGLAKEPK